MKPPEGTAWEWVLSGDVIDIRDGTHDTPKKVDSGIPLITSKNVTNGHIDFESATFISKEDHEAISKRSGVSVGDIIMPMIGTIGSPLVVDTDRPFSIKNVALFRKEGSGYNERFLFHLLKSPVVTKQLSSNKRGGTQKFVSLKVLRNLQLPHPPLEEQKRIAAILDKADALRRKRQQAIELTETFLRSVFLDMFGDPVTNPKGFEEVLLGDVCNVTSGVTKGRKLNGKQTFPAPYMRVANVQDGFLDLSEIKTIEATDGDLEKYNLLRGDMLMTEGGDPDKLGRGAIWREEVEGCIFQNHIFRVRVKEGYEEKLIPEYLSAIVGSIRGKLYFLREAKQTTGIATINSRQIKGFPLLLPDIKLQKQYLRTVSSIRVLKRDIEKSLKQMELLFCSVAGSLFAGPNDEREASFIEEDKESHALQL